MPAGHTDRDTINQRRPLTENMRATLQMIIDDASVPVSQMTQQQKNAARALHDRDLVLWIDTGDRGSYIATDAGRAVAASRPPELAPADEAPASSSDDTPLSAWVAGEKARLDEFAAWWAAGNRNDCEMYPSAMPDGEWDDQYRGWSGG